MIKIMKYGVSPDEEIFSKSTAQTDVSGIVSDIIKNVAENGDQALFEYSKKFDKAELSSLEVSEDEIAEAMDTVDPEFIRVINEAAENIRDFHKHQLRNDLVISGKKDGVILGQKITPIEKVGVYVPAGTASLPSTVLMTVIPAKIAGCSEIVMVTPPNPSGKASAVITAAAKIAGVDRIFKVGGAQAVAALAYGTETVPRVDKIVGPGNAFVAEAKKQVFGRVAIDMIAGPSDILVIADKTADPKFVAADLLSQAEHDKMASAVLVTDSQALADEVCSEIEAQLAMLPRAEIAGASIESNGKIIVTDTLDDAVTVADRIAPEHIEICLDNPFEYLGKIKNAGSIFLGKYCPEALGDYLAGPNHTLPTNGTARFSSPLSVDDFIKKSQFSYFTSEALEKVYKDVAFFAEQEGLHAHAKSATIRFEK